MFQDRRALAALLVILIALTGLAASCTPAPGPTPPPPAGPTILRIGMFSAPKTFNVLTTTDAYSLRAPEMMFGVLARPNNDQIFEPYLAAWEVSDDGLRWTFDIRQDANWSDGQPFSAHDAYLTWHLLTNKEVGAILLGKLRNIAGVQEYFDGTAESISGLEVVDEKTLEVTLLKPSAVLLEDICYPIVPYHILGDTPMAEINSHPFWTNPSVSVGPYVFAEYRTDQHIRLVKNETYFLGEPVIDEVIFQIGTQDTLLAQLERGELDLVPIPPAEADRIAGLSGVTLHRAYGAGALQTVHVNLTRPYLQDKRVRQAMMYAIDREGIAATAYEGYATVHNVIGMPTWAWSENENTYPWDPDQAIALLNDAGWNPDQVVVLVVPTGNKARELIGPIIKEQFADVGIKVDILTVDFSTSLDRFRGGDFDIGILGWGFTTDPNMTSIVYHSRSIPPAGWNIQHYRNLRVDELYDAGATTLEHEQRVAIYREVREILNDEVPSLWLIKEDNLFGLSNKIQGTHFRSFGLWGVPVDLWNVHEWRIE